MSLPYPYVTVRVSDAGGENYSDVDLNISLANGLPVDLEDLTDAVQAFLMTLTGADHTLATKYEVVTTSPF